jgi:hypothetical protein
MKRVKVEQSFVCDEDVEAMSEVEGGRACARCGHVVRDLAAMRQEDALRMLGEARARGEQVCVWQLHGAAGETLFLDSPAEELQLARQLRGAARMMLRAASLLTVLGGLNTSMVEEDRGDVLMVDEGAPVSVSRPFYEREEYQQRHVCTLLLSVGPGGIEPNGGSKLRVLCGDHEVYMSDPDW